MVNKNESKFNLIKIKIDLKYDKTTIFLLIS